MKMFRKNMLKVCVKNNFVTIIRLKFEIVFQLISILHIFSSDSHHQMLYNHGFNLKKKYYLEPFRITTIHKGSIMFGWIITSIRTRVCRLTLFGLVFYFYFINTALRYRYKYTKKKKNHILVSTRLRMYL